MIRIPLCGTITGAITEVATIFIGSKECFGPVLFENIGAGSVDILKDGKAAAIATLAAGAQFALAADSLIQLDISFTEASTITYKGCICNNGTQECCTFVCE